MDFDHERVGFMDAKENKSKVRKPRNVPILFQWVLVGLKELREDYEQREHKVKARPENEGPPVCLTYKSSYFMTRTIECDTFRKAMKTLGLPDDYRLKVAQKCHIEQLRSMDLLDTSVAQLTGHSIETCFKHYVKANDYRRLDRHNYEEFGIVSENGRYWIKDMFAAYLSSVAQERVE